MQLHLIHLGVAQNSSGAATKPYHGRENPRTVTVKGVITLSITISLFLSRKFFLPPTLQESSVQREE